MSGRDSKRESDIRGKDKTMRDSMVFYRSFFDATKDLPPEIYKEAMIALLEYALNGEIGNLSPTAKMFVMMAKPQIDANNQRYINGCKGGRKSEAKQEKVENTESVTEPSQNQVQTESKPELTEAKPKETNLEPNVYVYDNVNENVYVNDNKKHMCTAEADALFERLWEEYPVKKGKGQVSATQKKKLLAIGETALFKAIKRYRAELDKDSWRRAQNGGTFFNSGYVDYLDDNFVPDKVIAPKKQNKAGNQFCNFEQRDTDYDAMVKNQMHEWLDQAERA